MLVKQVMKKPIVIDKDTTLDKAARIMSEKDISSLLMVKGNKLTGIITEEDLVEHFGKKKKVSSVMNKDLIVIDPNEKASRAIDLMKTNKISILPVVDKKTGLVGVVAAKDLINHVCESEDFMIG